MKSLTTNEIIDLCASTERILHAVGIEVLKRFQGEFEIHFKGEFDMVTEIDLASEKSITNSLFELTPDFRILAEESSGSHLDQQPGVNLSSPYTWILDPIDGTTNFAHGVPHFAISLALYKDSKPIFGIIHDPSKNETFTAVKNQGLLVNGRSATVSSVTTLEESLVATGFPYKVRELKKNNLMEFCAFRLHCQGVRRFGSAALDLAYVACGRLDGFWERWLNPWDTAAGVLLVTEAGGTITQFSGDNHSIFDSTVMATNGKIHSQMLKVINSPLPELPEITRLF